MEGSETVPANLGQTLVPTEVSDQICPLTVRGVNQG